MDTQSDFEWNKTPVSLRQKISEKLSRFFRDLRSSIVLFLIPFVDFSKAFAEIFITTFAKLGIGTKDRLWYEASMKEGKIDANTALLSSDHAYELRGWRALFSKRKYLEGWERKFDRTSFRFKDWWAGLRSPMTPGWRRRFESDKS